MTTYEFINHALSVRGPWRGPVAAKSPVSVNVLEKNGLRHLYPPIRAALPI
jgi:hypothetical protein